jgi:hypothetical protein
LGKPSATPIAAAALLTHRELTTATAVAPVSAWCRCVSVNHWLPWLNSRGETASSRKQAHGGAAAIGTRIVQKLA